MKKIKVCFCASSIAWITRNLKKSAKAKFKKMLKQGATKIIKHHKKHSKKHRTPAQKRATRNLIKWNKTHR